jgi:MerR family transcriptional regulator, copper efflux regulator
MRTRRTADGPVDGVATVGRAASDQKLVPIDEVARRFRIRSSTLRYYETRGLIAPTSRRGGRRWYGPDQVRRVAVIRFWQQQGLMSLGLVRELLDASATSTNWQQVVQLHIDDLRGQVAQLQKVQDFIQQSLSCSYHDRLDDCPDYEDLIWRDFGDPTMCPAGTQARGQGRTSDCP